MSARKSQPKSQLDAYARTLRTLVKQGENKVCADCKRNDPRWASWNIGVFLCIRCSGFHRAMGTHISCVKSIDLDFWNSEQMESIQKWGNARANKYWEHNLKPGHIPPEHKIEAFIRSKYELRRWAMKTPPPEDPSVLDEKPSAPPTSTSSPAPTASLQGGSPTPTPANRAAAGLTASGSGRRPIPPPAPAVNLIDDDDASVLSGVSTAAASTTALPGDGLQSRMTPVNTPTPSVASTPPVSAARSGSGSTSTGAGGGLFDEDWDTPVSAPAPTSASGAGGAGGAQPSTPGAGTNVKANIMSLFNTTPATPLSHAPPPNPVTEPPIGTWGLTAESVNPWSSSSSGSGLGASSGSGPALGLNSASLGESRTPGVWSTASNAGTTGTGSLSGALSPGVSDIWGSSGVSSPNPVSASAQTPGQAASKKDPFADIWN